MQIKSSLKTISLALILTTIALPSHAIDPRALSLCIQAETECQNSNTRELALKKAIEAVKIDPKEARCWRAKASALSHLDEKEAALEVIDKAIAIDPNNADNFSLKAVLLLSNNHGEEALKCINRALSLQDNWKNHLNKALVLQQLKRVPDALTETKLALKTKPTDIAILDLKATLEARLGLWQDALNTLNRIIPVADPKLYSTSVHLSKRASTYLHLKQYKLAAADAQLACKRSPLSREFKVLLIKIYQDMGDKSAAARELKALQEYDKDFTPIN